MLERLTDEEKVGQMKRIVDAEWGMFQNVNHMGGRADCQDDKITFYTMRLSQFGEWPDAMLLSYGADLEAAKLQQRNLVMEKYAYMMETTDYEYYKNQLAPFLPNIDSDTMQTIREIADYFVACETTFAFQYPNLSRAGRPITAGADSTFATSVETYTIGELKTYSPKTLQLFLEHIRAQKAAGKNMVHAIKAALVQYYGYSSMEDAEQKMKL